MDKQKRELAKQLQLFKLALKAPEINKTVASAQEFVSEYYAILREEWTHKIVNVWTPFRLASLLEKPELKKLNKQYRLLLKDND